MKRDCFLYKASTLFNRKIYIDTQNAGDILEYIEGNLKKFDYIVGRILELPHMHYEDFKQIEKGLSEMRIHPNGSNGRIYCKEVTDENGTFCIIAARVIEKKKSMKMTKEILDFIKPIQDYDYEFTD